jgi:4-amino-4-deoxy-L-arabinose transferase-like glycosyltransferase
MKQRNSLSLNGMVFLTGQVTFSSRAKSFASSHLDTFIVVAIFAVAGLFRLVNLLGWPRWYTDEGLYGEAGFNLYQGIIGINGYQPNPNAPLFGIISGLVSLVLGKDILNLRLVSVSFGIGCCILLFLLGREMYGRIAGVVSALFMAVSYNAVYMDRLGFNPSMFDFFLVSMLLSYTKLSKSNSRKWIFLLGISGAALLLTKIPQGVIGVLFPLVTLIAGRKYKILSKAMLLITIPSAAVYVVLSFVNNPVQYWYRLFVVQQGGSYSPKTMNAFLAGIVMAQPASQIQNQIGFYHYGLWTTFGFIATVFVILLAILRKDKRDMLLVVTFVLLIAPYLVLAGRISIWWIVLIGFLPVYAVTIGRIISEFFSKRLSRLLLVIPLGLLGLSEYSFGAQYFEVIPLVYFEISLIVFAFALVVLSLFNEDKSKLTSSFLKTRRSTFVRILPVAFVIFVIGMNLPYVIQSLNHDDSFDQQQVASWLNSHTQQGDLISVPSLFVYPIKSGVLAMEDDYVFYYNTGIPGLRVFPGIPLEIATPLYAIKYFLIDESFAGTGPQFGQFVSLIEGTWPLVYSIGNEQVYQNPATINGPIYETLFSGNAQGQWQIIGSNESTLQLVSPLPSSPIANDSAVVKITYQGPGNDVIRFRHQLNNTFSFAELPSTELYIRAWVYGDMSGRIFEIALRDSNQNWKRLQTYPVDGTFEWKGWNELQIPINSSAPQQDGFNSSAVAGFELNIYVPSNMTTPSTVLLGPVWIG